jgi:hypothetical protein
MINRAARANYPNTIWNGVTPSRPGGLTTHQEPDAYDWSQIVQEVIALEEHVTGDLLVAVRPRFATIEATDTVNYVREQGNATYYNIANMQLELALDFTQDVMVLFEAVSEAKNDHYRVLQYQLSLDGTFFTPNDLVQYNESGAPKDKERRKHFISYVFRNVPPGEHAIRARVSNAASGQSWDILYRRLTATY